MGNTISINNISVKKFVMTNNKMPNPNTQLAVLVGSNFQQNEKQYTCEVNIRIYVDEEKDIEEKTFAVDYTVSSVFSSEFTIELNDDTKKAMISQLLPHARANIAAAMGALGIEPIFVPYLL